MTTTRCEQRVQTNSTPANPKTSQHQRYNYNTKNLSKDDPQSRVSLHTGYLRRSTPARELSYVDTPPSQSTGMGQASPLFTQLPPHHLIIMAEVSQSSREPHRREQSVEHLRPSSVFHLVQVKDLPPTQLSHSGHQLMAEAQRPRLGPVGPRSGPHFHHRTMRRIPHQ
jgi:hypothetical protein